MDHDQSPPIEPAAPGDQGGGGDGTLPRYGRRAVLRTLTLGEGAGDLLRAVVKILPATSRRANDKVFLTNTGKQVASAAAFGLITVPDAKDRSARLAGGRLVQRLHLAATARGLAFHHLNAVTERIDRAEQLAARDVFTPQVASLLAASDRQLLVAFRIGLPTAAGRRSPRRPLREVVS